MYEIIINMLAQAVNEAPMPEPQQHRRIKYTMRTVMINDSLGSSMIDITSVSFCRREDNQVRLIVDGLEVDFQYDDEEAAADVANEIMLAMRNYENEGLWATAPQITPTPTASQEPIIYNDSGGEHTEINWQYVNENYRPAGSADVNMSADRNFRG
jgi:hypothetical protein